jgi:exodeoxyribonuclease VII small subunit
MTTPREDTDTRSVDGLSFEEAYAELIDVVAKLESGGLSLDDALALHARGVELAGRCGTVLEAAELRVREIDSSGEDAGPVDLSE